MACRRFEFQSEHINVRPNIACEQDLELELISKSCYLPRSDTDLELFSP